MNDLVAQAIVFFNSLWRRRNQALAIAWLVCLAAWAYIATLPNVYDSSARVYVDTRSILEPLLQGLAIDSNSGAEVEVMQRSLLTRPNIEKVARMTDLDITATNAAEMEELIERLKEKIEVRRVSQDALYMINYSNQDPQVAHDVVQALLTIFVENNLGQNRQDMDTARRFIEEQIADYEQQLEAAEQRLAKFKQENMSLLSGQQGYEGRLLSAQSSLKNVEGELQTATVRRNTLRQELKNTPEFFEVPNGQGASNGPPTNTALQILQFESTVETLLTRYTEQHPDVVTARRRLDALYRQQQEELDRAGPAGSAEWDGSSGVPNTLYEQLKLSLVNEEATIAALRQQVATANKSVEDLLDVRIQAPLVEAELTKLNRDYNVLKSKYEALLNRREAERISRAREFEADTIQFRIVEPPQVPINPSGPNRLLFLTLALIVGLGSGAGFAFLLTLSNDSISSVTQLRESFALPVLGVVGMQTVSKGRSWRAAKMLVFVTILAGLFVVYGGLVVVDHTLGLASVVSADLLFSSVPPQ